MKKLALYLLAIGSVQASEIDNLIRTSDSIKQTFNNGVQVIAGQVSYAQVGGISPDMIDQYHLTNDQATAYNDALFAMTSANTTMTAQEYFTQQSDQALDQLSTAVDNYVQASSQIIEAVVVNNMASNAETAEQVVEVQTYIESNDLAITEQSVAGYNDALDSLQQAAQTAAAFVAVANDQTLLDDAQEQMDDLGQSFYFAETVFYSQNAVTVDLTGGSIGLDVSGYLKLAEDVLTAGKTDDFYTTNPVCFFDPAACDL